MRLPRLLKLLVPVAAFALSACAPGIYVKRYQPARYNLGATRKAALLSVMGPPHATGVVVAELEQQMTNTGYFQVFDAMPQQVALEIFPGLTVVNNISTVRQQVPAEVYLTAQVTRWEYDERETVEEESVSNGQGGLVKVRKVYRFPIGHTAVSFQVVNAATGRVVVMREYSNRWEGSKFDPNTTRPDQASVIRASAAGAVDSFLDDITPATVTDKIVLDDDDAAMKPGIEQCKAGALDSAMATFDAILKSNPNNPGAAYNLGVLYEAKGDYTAAEQLYQKAISQRPKKSLYTEALNDMHRRIRDEESLRQQLQ